MTGKLWNLAAKFFKDLNTKSAQINKFPEQLYIDSEQFVLKIEKYKNMGNIVNVLQFFRLSFHISTNIKLNITENMKFGLIFHIKLVSIKNNDI